MSPSMDMWRPVINNNNLALFKYYATIENQTQVEAEKTLFYSIL